MRIRNRLPYNLLLTSAATLRLAVSTLLLTVATATASAATTYLWVAGTKVTGTGYITNKYITSGRVYFDASSKQLMLEDAVINVSGSHGIALEESGIEILVDGNCSITATSSDKNAIRLDASGLTASLKGFVGPSLEIPTLKLQGGSGKSGLHIHSKCTMTIVSQLIVDTKGKHGVDGYNGKSGETLVVKKNNILYAGGSTAAIGDLATLNLESPQEILSPEGGSFNTSKHEVVNSQGNRVLAVSIADYYGIKVAGTKVTALNAKTCGHSGRGSVTYNNGLSKTLTLTDATINGVGTEGIVIETTGVTVKVAGSCKVSTNSNSLDVIKLNADGISTTFKGEDPSATLSLTKGKAIGISKNSKLTVQDLFVDINTNNGIHGVNGTSGESLALKSGTRLRVKTGDMYPVRSMASFTKDASLEYLNNVSFNSDFHYVYSTTKDLLIGQFLGLEVAGKKVNNINYETCDYTGAGSVSFNPTAKMLKLNGVKYSGGLFLQNDLIDGLIIDFSGTNTINSHEETRSVMILNKSTTFQGFSTTALNSRYFGTQGKDPAVIVLKGENTRLTILTQGELNMLGNMGVDLADDKTSMLVDAKGAVYIGGNISLGGKQSEVSFTGTGTYDIGKEILSDWAAIHLNYSATGAKLTIGDNVSGMQIHGIFLYGSNQTIAFGAAKNLSLTKELSASVDGGTLTFSKTQASLTPSNGKQPIRGFSTVNLTDCDFSTPYTFWHTANMTVANQGGDVKGGTIQLEPVTTKYGIYFGKRQMNDVNCTAFYNEDFVKGDASYNASTRTLTMNNVSMTYRENQYPVFDNYSVDGLTIILNGTCRFTQWPYEGTTNSDPVVRFRGSTILKPGTSEGVMDVYKGNLGYGDLWIGKSATLTVKNKAKLRGSSITGDNQGTLAVNNATVSLTGDNQGTIQKLAKLVLTDARIETPHGATYNTQKRLLVTSSGSTVTSNVSIVPGDLLAGDANGDGKVNAADIVIMVNYTKGISSSKFVKTAADVNGDGKVDKTDINLVIKSIMSAK